MAWLSVGAQLLRPSPGTQLVEYFRSLIPPSLRSCSRGTPAIGPGFGAKPAFTVAIVSPSRPADQLVCLLR
jgi:hypothetical protein